MAYAGGEVGLFAPWLTGRGFDLKVALAEAAIAGIDAIRAVDPEARIVNVDPMCRVAAPAGRTDLDEAVEDFLGKVPQAKLADVSDAAHMVAGDQNDTSSNAVIEFLENDVRPTLPR